VVRYRQDDEGIRLPSMLVRMTDDGDILVLRG
jgi:hypothetical protein